MVERLARFMLAVIAAIALLAGAAAGEDKTMTPLKVAVLGDSLTAGHGLKLAQAFPSRLETALRAKGFKVEIINAGVSGDTATDGLDRLDWSIRDVDAVIVELGANDGLRGIDPKVTRASLDEIVKRLRQQNIAVMLAGMYAPPNYGEEFAKEFNSIFPDIAKAYDLTFYPFFLDGVVTDPKLNLGDGLHPTAAGVDVIVERILPTVEAFLAKVAAQQR
jgi:acyl-CoA thioesterase-1